MTDRDGWPNLCLFFSEDLNCGLDKDRWAVTGLIWATDHVILHIWTSGKGTARVDGLMFLSSGVKRKTWVSCSTIFFSIKSFLLKLCQVLIEWRNGVGSFQWQYSASVNHHLKWTDWYFIFGYTSLGVNDTQSWDPRHYYMLSSIPAHALPDIYCMSLVPGFYKLNSSQVTDLAIVQHCNVLP